MVKEKGRGRRQAFRSGINGGCEAVLFEFRAKEPVEPSELRIAACSFDEAGGFLRRHEPDFVVDRVLNLGVILLVSGSPID
jgi:hypothetical protein